jgi:predicted PurR-regulated permease PerM
LGGRGSLAAALLVLLYITVLVVPLVLVGDGLVDRVSGVTEWIKAQLQQGLPPAPKWLGQLPVFGKQAKAFYNDVAKGGERAVALARDAIGPVSSWLLAAVGALGQALGELLLALICTGIFYANGEAAARGLRGIVQRLGGDEAERLIGTAHGTIQAVVYGLVGAALAQAVIAGIGFAIAGVDGAFPLAVATFFVCLLPFGALPIWLPVTIWQFVQGETEWGIFLLLWNLLLTNQADNFIKPIVIARGSPLPILLVFVGVLGGALAFGFLGLFLGPAILSILFVMIRTWSPPVAEGTPMPATLAKASAEAETR